MIRRLVRSPALAAEIAAEEEPGVGCASRAELLEFARTRAGSLYHLCGTARMGRDSGAVVDARLRVRGTAGLRIVDCSIIPAIPSGNTNAAAIMIGEKGSDLVLADARNGE